MNANQTGPPVRVDCYSGLVFRSRNINTRALHIEERILSIATVLGVYTGIKDSNKMKETENPDMSINDAALSTIDTLTKIEQALIDVELFLTNTEES